MSGNEATGPFTTCQAPRTVMVGKPGTYGYHAEAMLCVKPFGHPGRHTDDDGETWHTPTDEADR